jgi:hypothetical protein
MRPGGLDPAQRPTGHPGLAALEVYATEPLTDPTHGQRRLHTAHRQRHAPPIRAAVSRHFDQIVAHAAGAPTHVVNLAAHSIHQIFTSEIAPLPNGCAISGWVAWSGYKGAKGFGCALTSGAPGELMGFGRVSAQWSF